jgi:hypothetical protein
VQAPQRRRRGIGAAVGRLIVEAGRDPVRIARGAVDPGHGRAPRRAQVADLARQRIERERAEGGDPERAGDRRKLRPQPEPRDRQEQRPDGADGRTGAPDRLPHKRGAREGDEAVERGSPGWHRGGELQRVGQLQVGDRSPQAIPVPRAA